MIKKLTALTNLPNYLTVLWQSQKVFKILASVVAVFFIAGGTFITLKGFEKRKAKVFAATAAIPIELPQGIKKENLQNLSEEQKKKLDEQIASVLTAKKKKKNLAEPETQIQIIVLTQNNQPILPDLDRGVGGTSEQTIATPTSAPAAREEPTPTPTLPPPCTDTDGGKDIFTKGTLTTSYGDKKTDFCTDPTIIGEYYCVPDASFAFGGFECPGNCVDGACQQVTPTPTRSISPTIALSPTVTPTPTNIPCTDSDGGVDIFTKGTVFTWGTNYNDICYSNNTKVFEYSCQPFGYQGDLLACQYGCQDSACLKNPPTATPSPSATPKPTNLPTSTPTPTPTENYLTFVFAGDIEQKYKQQNNRDLKDDVNKIYESIKKIYGPPFRNNTVKIKIAQNTYYNLTLNEIGLAQSTLSVKEVLIQEIVAAFHDDIIPSIPEIWEVGLQSVVTQEVMVDVFTPEKKNQARFPYPFFELVAPNPGWVSQGGNFLAINDFSTADSYHLLFATLYKPFIEDSQFYINFNRELYKLSQDPLLFYKMPMIALIAKPEIEGMSFDEWFNNQYILQILPLPGKFIIPFLEKNQDGKMVIYAKAVEVLENGDRKKPAGQSVTIHAFDYSNQQVWFSSGTTSGNGQVEFGEMPSATAGYIGYIRFEISLPGFDTATFYYPYWGGQALITEVNPPLGVFGSVINGDDGQLDLQLSDSFLLSIGTVGHGAFSSASAPRISDTKGKVKVTFMGDREHPAPIASKTITKDVGDYYTLLRIVKAATGQTRGLPPAPTGNEDIVDGMKLFISEKLGFKIRYPAELFAYEWKSDEQPNFNLEKPDFDKNVVQFFKNADLYGAKITINRYTNPQRKTAKDYAKAYWSASEESLKHWKPKDIDFVIHTVKVQGEGEEKSYLTPLGDWMYIFEASDASLQPSLEKMLPTLEFTGTGEALSELLTPCPDDLLSTAEQLNEVQENWWEKPDECNNRPEQKVCGYIRSIYDNGIVQVGSQNYRNLYCYCSFFEKDGSRTFRGTEMFSLGYQEGECK